MEAGLVDLEKGQVVPILGKLSYVKLSYIKLSYVKCKCKLSYFKLRQVKLH